jgi:hypothetical protein
MTSVKAAQNSIYVFYSYAHEDEELRKQLEKQPPKCSSTGSSALKDRKHIRERWARRPAA